LVEQGPELFCAAQAWPRQVEAPSCKEEKMGVMTRDQGGRFVVTSDRILGEAKSIRVAKKMSSTYSVWTGDTWSSVMTDAMTFATAEAADDYIRANSDRVMKDG
jgi:hypothetical protein